MLDEDREHKERREKIVDLQLRIYAHNCCGCSPQELMHWSNWTMVSKLEKSVGG